MKKIFVFHFFVSLSLLLSCEKSSESAYQKLLKDIPKTIIVDTTRNISFVLYNPLGCLPCNSILSNLLIDDFYKSSFANNTFIVFPSIRSEELLDYKKNMTEYGQIQINYINDIELYELLRTKYPNPNDTRPALIAIKKSNGQFVYIGLKETYLKDSIKKYFID